MLPINELLSDDIVAGVATTGLRLNVRLLVQTNGLLLTFELGRKSGGVIGPVHLAVDLAGSQVHRTNE